MDACSWPLDGIGTFSAIRMPLSVSCTLATNSPIAAGRFGFGQQPLASSSKQSQESDRRLRFQFRTPGARQSWLLIVEYASNRAGSRLARVPAQVRAIRVVRPFAEPLTRSRDT